MLSPSASHSSCSNRAFAGSSGGAHQCSRTHTIPRPPHAIPRPPRAPPMPPPTPLPLLPTVAVEVCMRPPHGAGLSLALPSPFDCENMCAHPHIILPSQERLLAAHELDAALGRVHPPAKSGSLAAADHVNVSSSLALCRATCSTAPKQGIHALLRSVRGAALHRRATLMQARLLPFQQISSQH